MRNKKIKELCERAGMECSLGHWYIEDEHLERFAELVRQEEREACAKICDDWFNSLASEPEMEKIAAEIRARGNT